MDGRLADPHGVLGRTIFPRVRAEAARVEVYGEKHVTYGPFIPYLYAELECRFIFIHRDGRDVVRSLIDWHDKKFGTIYRECRDPGTLTRGARDCAARLLVHMDTSDYSRPRPRPGEPLFDEWESLSRFEMCAYYWSYINDVYLSQLATLPESAWTSIDYTRPTVTDIDQVASFVGLRGLNPVRVNSLLNQRINSLTDRNTPPENPFPPWQLWSEDRRRRFDRFAGSMMRRLGYYPPAGSVNDTNISDVEAPLPLRPHVQHQVKSGLMS
jgi:hypothetical protein